MVSPVTEHLAERQERLLHLVAEIDAAILDGENVRDHNTLGLTLLVRALDIFHANYDEEDVLEILNFMFADRKIKRQLPITQEYIDASERAAKWLALGK
jgi:hypothetical protein